MSVSRPCSCMFWGVSCVRRMHGILRTGYRAQRYLVVDLAHVCAELLGLSAVACVPVLEASLLRLYLCPHHPLTPSSSPPFVCNPIPTVNKKLSAAYNLVVFSDSPDTATKCPSIEMLNGVLKSGCPVAHSLHTPSWWHCHINKKLI